MKRILKTGIVCAAVFALVGGCGKSDTGVMNEATIGNEGNTTNSVVYEPKVFEGAVNILLSDEQITVDGAAISTDNTNAVYAANDIVYYEAGKDFTYGEGEENDEHTKEEADKHMVVHITQPGTYAVSGNLSAGQIAIDLGEGAAENPEAIVNLIMNNADITCSVAPAVIFYNVYECGVTEEDKASKDVDTTAAGANVLIADGTMNNITGSYVAKIYKTVQLNEAGTEVVDSKKLHKYDAAFYSKMTMNIDGDEKGTGILNIKADNEGLDSELHLTINGGNINITSGNDGINTNEDGISVTTINGGNLTVVVNGSTGEGDGIDSNGWLVINGGNVNAYACSTSGDAGIDSDMGIHINGGNVVATGNMLDRISESTQNYAVFNFSQRQSGGTEYVLKDENLVSKADVTTANDFTYLIVSNADLNAGTYTMWSGETQYEGSMGEGGMPEGMGRPEMEEMPSGGIPEDMEMPEGMGIPEMGEIPSGGIPEDMEMPEGMGIPEMGEIPSGGIPEDMEMPEGMGRPEMETNADGTITLPDGTTINPSQMIEEEKGQFGGNRGEFGGGRNNMVSGEVYKEFVINDGGNYFNQVSVIQ